MGREFSIVPKSVPRVETRYRRIVTELPPPASLPILELLRTVEPVSMRGQPPVVWDRAEDVAVYDAWGNQWLDWSSGVLVANAGHGAPEVRRAIVDQVESGLLHNYCFPSRQRAELVEYLARLAPTGLDKVFLLTTGAATGFPQTIVLPDPDTRIDSFNVLPNGPFPLKGKALPYDSF